MSDLIFHQLFEKETSTYTYLLADPLTKEAILIDPLLDMLERDLKLIQELELKLKYVFDTHLHADHVTAAGELRARLACQIGISANYNLTCQDLGLKDQDELFFGGHKVRVLATPGHTNGCMSFHVDNMIFTGDALLIRGCGRTDFQDGDSKALFNSVRSKIFTLNENTLVFPAHDYQGHTHSSVGLEKKHNPRLNLSISEKDFIKIMQELKLSHPKRIDVALPANKLCGLNVKKVNLSHEIIEGVPTVEPSELLPLMQQVVLIDVRTFEEFEGELGHIQDSLLQTLGENLEAYLSNADKSETYVFICRIGARSAMATQMAQAKGIKKVFNLKGGMMLWNQLNLPTENNAEKI